MEWMLQVVDELDDAVGTLRHGCLGLAAETGVVLLAGFGVAAEAVGPSLGAQPALVGAGALTVSVAAFLKARGGRLAPQS
jgi:hypothetical protein